MQFQTFDWLSELALKSRALIGQKPMVYRTSKLTKKLIEIKNCYL